MFCGNHGNPHVYETSPISPKWRQLTGMVFGTRGEPNWELDKSRSHLHPVRCPGVDASILIQSTSVPSMHILCTYHAYVLYMILQFMCIHMYVIYHVILCYIQHVVEKLIGILVYKYVMYIYIYIYIYIYTYDIYIYIYIYTYIHHLWKVQNPLGQGP